MTQTLQRPLVFALAHAVTHDNNHFYSIIPNIMYVRWQGASTLPLPWGYVRAIALIAIVPKKSRD